MTFVFGYDETPGAERALEVAIELAARFAEPLILVYGVTPPGGQGEEFRAHQEALVEIGQRATQRAMDRATAAGVSAQVALVHDKPARALVEVADQHDARMIIVGSYGETSLRGAILGSTPFRLLNSSDRPVLVVKA